MIEIQVRYLARQREGIGQPGEFIGRRMPRDRRCLEYRLTHCRGTQIRGAGRALGLAKIQRHRQPAVAVVLDRVDLPETHRRAQAPLQTRVRFSLARAARARLPEGQGDHVLQFADPRGIDLLRHIRIPLPPPRRRATAPTLCDDRVEL